MPPDEQRDLATVSTPANYDRNEECQKSSSFALFSLISELLFSFDLKLERTSKHKGTVLLTATVFIVDGHLLK